jgi:hypothetical protein
MFRNGTLKVNGSTKDINDYFYIPEGEGKDLSLSVLYPDLEDKALVAKWFDKAENIQLASQLMSELGYEREGNQFAIEINQRKKSGLGKNILVEYTRQLFIELKFLMESISNLYYKTIDYTNKTAVKSTRPLSDCIRIARKASQGLTELRYALIENVDPGRIYKTIIDIEDKEAQIEHDQATKALDSTQKKSKKKKD